MEIFTSFQMASADRHAIESLGICSVVLMENAGIAVAEEISKLSEKTDKILVVAGLGNNGGDGYVLVRQLFNRGFHVNVLSVEPEKLKNDALINYNIVKKLPVGIFRNIRDFNFKDYDVIVDALFGTGLNRPVAGDLENLIKNINISGKKIFSIDIPSGLSGDSWNIVGTCVKADFTVTFCRPKIPHCMYPAKSMCGKVVVREISIPDVSVKSVKSDTFILNRENVPKLKKRSLDCHKGDFGHTVIVGGSEGKIGAAAICASASVRMGSGLTTVVAPKNYISSIHNIIPEAMCLQVSSKDNLGIKDYQDILNFLKDKDVVAIGPGIGRESETEKLIRNIIINTALKVVIDADGLSFLDEETLDCLKFRCVLTPHIGEFSRLLKLSKEDVLENRLEVAKNFATKYSVVLVLKSADTIIAMPDGVCFIFNEGSPVLAKGGSGDCLAGIISALISQGNSIEDSALSGVYVHGKTGGLLGNKFPDFFPKAMDIVENLWISSGELY